MALNDLSAVAEDDGMVTRIERIAYIEGYKSLLVKDNVFASVDGFSSIIPRDSIDSPMVRWSDGSIVRQI